MQHSNLNLHQKQQDALDYLSGAIELTFIICVLLLLIFNIWQARTTKSKPVNHEPNVVYQPSTAGSVERHYIVHSKTNPQ